MQGPIFLPIPVSSATGTCSNLILSQNPSGIVNAILRDLAFALSPGIYGNCPFNTVIRGFPGTGKTTAIHTMFAELEKTSQRLLPVYINCQTDRTQFATFSRIYEKLHGYQPPTSGTPIRKVIHDIGSTLKERNKVLIICLDDADYLISGNVLNDLLFSLLHLYEEFPKVRIGVIISLSSMDIDLVQVLDPCVISILRPKEIYFPPYNEEEIRCILSDRINNGLYPGVMPEDLFDLVVENTMRSGDIRIGFDLVKTSVITAELAERPVVCEADVTGSYTVSKQDPTLIVNPGTGRKRAGTSRAYCRDVPGVTGLFNHGSSI